MSMFFLIGPILEARAEIFKKYLFGFLGDLKTPNFPSGYLKTRMLL